jgi:hypothetical protein
MNLEHVEKIAEAVLYEGYMLYPYRASAIKNQQRWNFGVLCPQSYSEKQNGTEAWTMQTECLLQGGTSARLSVKIRFLQIVNRSIGKITQPLRELPAERESAIEIVSKLQVGDQTFAAWQEAVEREVTVSSAPALSLHPPLSFQFLAGWSVSLCAAKVA